MNPDANVAITFRHMDHSDVIEAHAIKELEKLDKFLQNEKTPINIDIVIEKHPTHANNVVELRVRVPQHFFIGKDEGPDIIPLIDSVILKVEKEMRRAKERVVDDLKKGLPRR